jgi:drug/metabolite transporter (DMT)-like permease
MSIAQAYKMAPATTIAPFYYSEIIAGALFGYLIWHSVPPPHLFVGAAIIIAAGVYIVIHTRKAARLLEEEAHA